MKPQIQLAPLKQVKSAGKYILEKEIGTGGFAKVFMGSSAKSNEKFAIKVIKREQAKELDIMSYVENELRIISRLNHPNIVKVYDIIYTDDSILIVMEYMANGDLQRFIDDNYCFNIEDQVRIALEILEALAYLHQRGISHRDIKPANIMFDKEMHAKLIDFGFCRENTNIMKTICGTQLLMAPEVLLNHSYDGIKADIWSYGVTLHIMATRHIPFVIKSESQFVHDCKSNNLAINIRCGGVIGWLVQACLQTNPDERFTAVQLLEFIKSQQTAAVAPIPVARLTVVKRANTSAQIQKVKLHANTPVIIRSRVCSEGNLAARINAHHELPKIQEN